MSECKGTMTWAEPTMPRWQAEKDALRLGEAYIQAARWYVKTAEPATGWTDRTKVQMMSIYMTGLCGSEHKYDGKRMYNNFAAPKLAAYRAGKKLRTELMAGTHAADAEAAAQVCGICQLRYDEHDGTEAHRFSAVRA